MNKKLDILAFAAHPDDVELACSGTLIKEAKNGKLTGIVDLTLGQLGTRGTPEIRLSESQIAGKILGLSARENLELEDGFFHEDKETIIKIVTAIRNHKPTTVLINATKDRHPDHGRASSIVRNACYYSGLKKIETGQEPHRPENIYSYIQDYYLKPDFIVDITAEFETKMNSILAYSSQFYDPNNQEPNTPISSKDFLQFIESRAREFGRLIGVEFGEGFQSEKPIKFNSLS